jgi:hypothetical protein
MENSICPFPSGEAIHACLDKPCHGCILLQDEGKLEGLNRLWTMRIPENIGFREYKAADIHEHKVFHFPGAPG